MKKEDLKTIDVSAKEWFDKINGNSYFSAVVTLNYGMADEQTINIPFQYGYGDHYKDITVRELERLGLIESGLRLLHLREKGIIIRASKQENCRKKDL